MTLIIPTTSATSHTITAHVVLVGTSPRIGFFDRSGMLLDTSFRTYLRAGSNDVACTLELVLYVPNMALFVQSKVHSPVTTWLPNSTNTSCSQTMTIGPSTNAAGITSGFNVIVGESWGDPNSIWMDPTWPLGHLGSGGPKSVGASAQSSSYFYLRTPGTQAAPLQIPLWVNVDRDASGQPYLWLANEDGVCAGTTLVLFPPVIPPTSMVVELQLHAGYNPYGYELLMPQTTTLDYTVARGCEGALTIDLREDSTQPWVPTTIEYRCETAAPGPIW